MKLKTRDLVSTLLIALIAVPYVSYLVRGEMPFVEDARGMAAVGLILGTAAYAVIAQGDPADRADRLEDVVALVAFVLGFTAFALAETAAAEVLLAVFMGSILVAWGVKLLDHAGVLHTAHPTGA
jgi:hypothetical protein